MTREDARKKLQAVLQEVFDDDSFEAGDTVRREDVAAWDSLGHIRLVSAVEEAFGVSLTIEQIEAMTSVGSILDLLNAGAAHG